MPKAVILVVEDDPDIREVVRFNLEREGYSVLSASRGEEALALVRRSVPDLVVLDIMLPGLDGLEVCKAMRKDLKTTNVPVVMLTAKADESDVIRGFELGADDYVTKPFSPKVLTARVKAALRRAAGAPGRASHRAGSIEVDEETLEVRVDGRAVRLTPVEFRMLAEMVKHPGRVYSRQELLGAAVGPEKAVTGRTVDVHMASLRKKLGREGRLLQTVWGVGYRLEEE